MSLKKLELQLKFLAKQISPFDKGAAMRAIKSQSTANQIHIWYDISEAPHIEFLEEGTRNSGKHVGYISQNTVYAFNRHIYDVFNNQRGSETINIPTLAQKTKVTPAGQQQLLDILSR